MAYPSSKRIYQVAQAFRENISVEEVENLTTINPWFLNQVKDIIDLEKKIVATELTKELLLEAKKNG